MLLSSLFNRHPERAYPRAEGYNDDSNNYYTTKTRSRPKRKKVRPFQKVLLLINFEQKKKRHIQKVNFTFGHDASWNDPT